MIPEVSGYQSDVGRDDTGNLGSDRVERLKNLVHRLLAELCELKEPRTFAETEFCPGSKIDFRNEVRRYETELIEWALGVTGGHQLKAAKLLGVKPTTLNEKIRTLGVVPRKTRPRVKPQAFRKQFAPPSPGQD